jgi:hypothetical protein
MEGAGVGKQSKRTEWHSGPTWLATNLLMPVTAGTCSSVSVSAALPVLFANQSCHLPEPMGTLAHKQAQSAYALRWCEWVRGV